MLKQNQYQEQKNTENYIKARSVMIKDLEKDMKDVNDIMNEIANLICQQEPFLDNIESNIEKSIKETDIGIIELTKAEKNMKRRHCVII